MFRPGQPLLVRLRFWLLPLVAASLVGCALPALPKLPSLPKLPALPKLPSLPKLPGRGEETTPTKAQQAAQAAVYKPTESTGHSLKEAFPMAIAQADTWSESSVLMKVQGTKLDFGGREGGHPDGTWTFLFRSDEKKDTWLKVRVSDGAASPAEMGAADDVTVPLGRSLDAVIDSPDVFTRAGFKGATYTLVLRRQGEISRYNLVEEGGTARMVLDAQSGAILADDGYEASPEL